MTAEGRALAWADAWAMLAEVHERAGKQTKHPTGEDCGRCELEAARHRALALRAWHRAELAWDRCEAAALGLGGAP